MRYLLHESQHDELLARQKYLYDVFHLYFIPDISDNGFITLKSVGCCFNEILFITGHDRYVMNYLRTCSEFITETTIVITSCGGDRFKEYANNKTLFVPDDDQYFCYYRDGRPFGFDFPITDNELNLYNTNGSIIDRIRQVYKQIC